MNILGIETSCDETGIAIYNTEQGLLAHALYSQIKLHADYGGVVPELASRDHIRKIIPLIEQTLQKANITKEQLDGIAYTAGPGLIGALLVGATVAKSLAFALNIPALAINHMEGHLLAPMLEPNPPTFPFIALLVSGGHTMLVEVDDIGKYKLLGESLDDAAGEAFDKTAKLLGLPYPGGPNLAKLAQSGTIDKFHFTRPMINRPGLDFSFSGLKTAVLNAYSTSDKSDQTKADIACAFQDCVVDTLMRKCKRALVQTNTKTLIVSGGVSANKLLRERLDEMGILNNWQIAYPRLEFCTDNGAMIAYAGALRLQKGLRDDLTINVKARWAL